MPAVLVVPGEFAMVSFASIVDAQALPLHWTARIFVPGHPEFGLDAGVWVSASIPLRVVSVFAVVG